jgi:hypothetical protein
LTSDQKHTDHIATGQRVSRHSLPTLLCFIFFPTAQNILKFFGSRTNGTFAFAPTLKANPSANAKEPFFANAPIKNRILDTILIDRT